MPNKKAQHLPTIYQPFIFITFGFTFPIIFLFFFMISFKNSHIVFSEQKIHGTLQLQNLYINILSPVQEGFITQIKDIGDQSKLILDPDLDSFYLMNSVVNHLPSLILYFDRLKIINTLNTQKKFNSNLN